MAISMIKGQGWRAIPWSVPLCGIFTYGLKWQKLEDKHHRRMAMFAEYYRTQLANSTTPINSVEAVIQTSQARKSFVCHWSLTQIQYL